MFFYIGVLERNGLMNDNVFKMFFELDGFFYYQYEIQFRLFLFLQMWDIDRQMLGISLFWFYSKGVRDLLI